MFCPKCGTEVKADDAVCGNCGFPQKIRNGEEKTEFSAVNNSVQSVAAEDADIDKTVAAPHIGGEAQNDLDATVRSENLGVRNAAPAAPVSPAAPAPVTQPVPPVKQAKAAKPTKEKKPLKINKGKIIGAAITAVVLVVVGVGAWHTATYFMSKNAMQISGGLDQELALGDKYLKDMDYDKALLAYEAAIEIDENNPQAHYGYARANAGLLNYERAEESYLTAISLDEMYADAYNGLIELYIQQDSEDNQTMDKAKELVYKAVNEVKIDDEVLLEKYYGMYPEKPAPDIPPTEIKDGGRYAIVLADKHGGAVYYTHEYQGAPDNYGEQPEPKAYTEPIVLQNGKNTINAYVVSSYGVKSDTAKLEYNINRVDTPITFTDKEVENAVRRALGKNSEPIYDDEIATITELSIVGSSYTNETTLFTQTEYFIGGSYGSSYQGNVTNLSDLKYMPFLETLNISFQQNLDISTLPKSESLKNLSLIHVNLTSVEKIKDLKNLEKLCLGWNSLTDINPLGSLTNLTHLGVWGNNITNIGVVSKLPKLEYLDVSDNNVSVIAAVGGLTELREFWAYGNSITDFSALVNLKKLKVLMISGNPVSDMADLKKIYPRLTKVDIQIV